GRGGVARGGAGVAPCRMFFTVPALPARDALVAFRGATYAAFGARCDALFDLLDALLTGARCPRRCT
ncbi:MAG: hypothetical protein ACRDJN_19080, partial [Chloroflexota bacterium]